MSDINLKEIEFTKISLNPGDILAVKLTDNSSEIDNEYIDNFRKKIQKCFPNNKVIIFRMEEASDIQFTAIESTQESSCGPQACSDCNCGKKERLEALNELTEETEKLKLYNEFEE
jgi:hypothetical protein